MAHGDVRRINYIAAKERHRCNATNLFYINQSYNREYVSESIASSTPLAAVILSFRHCNRQILEHILGRAWMFDENQVETTDALVRTVVGNVDHDIIPLTLSADIRDVKLRSRYFTRIQTERRNSIRYGIDGALKHGLPVTDEMRVEWISFPVGKQRKHEP